MVLAIVRKELRETRAFVALALVLYLVYVSNLTGKGGPLLRVAGEFRTRDERDATGRPVRPGEFREHFVLHRGTAGDGPGVPAVGLGAEPGDGVVPPAPASIAPADRA